jgi:hypothetical protein
MPAHAGIHDFFACAFQKASTAFLKKSSPPRAAEKIFTKRENFPRLCRTPRNQKFFCFFFCKKRRAYFRR